MAQIAIAVLANQFPIKPIPAGSITFTVNVCYVDSSTSKTEMIDGVTGVVAIVGITLGTIGKALTDAIIAKGATLGFTLAANNVKLPGTVNGVP